MSTSNRPYVTKWLWGGKIKMGSTWSRNLNCTRSGETEETCTIKKNKFCLEIYTVRWVFFPMITQPCYLLMLGGKKKKELPLVWIFLSLSSSFPCLPPHTWALIALFTNTALKKDCIKKVNLNTVQLSLISFRSRSYTQRSAKWSCVLNLHCYKTMAFQWCNSSHQWET